MASLSSFSSNLLSPLIILLATHPCGLFALSNDAPVQTSPSSPTTPALVNNPADGDTAPAAFTPSSASSAIPSATDSAGYSDNDSSSNAGGTTTTTTPHNALLNYYFLFLAVFVIAMLTIYWSLARRRRKAAAQLSAMQQAVLAEDVRNWTRHREAGYIGFDDEERGRMRREEGLDESGQPPPAYVKEPERVHLRRAESVEMRVARLREMVGVQSAKPPDYEERGS